MPTTNDILSYAEASGNLTAVMDKVWNDHAPVIITREGGRHVVVMSKEEYDSLCETEYLLSSPANAAALNEAADQVAAGKTVAMRIDPASGKILRED